MSIGIPMGMTMNNFWWRARNIALAAVLVTGFTSAAPAATAPTAQSLLASCGIDTSRLQIASAEGIVIVRGKVPDRESVRQVSEILQSSGYPRVANLLTVASAPDDDALRRTVERQLVRTRSLEGCRFHISAHGGVVVLNGTVHRDLQRDVAADLARSVDGVLEVVNNLERSNTAGR